MGREFSKMEDDFELSLELSIGGRYAKSENSKNIEGKTGDFSDENLSRSDFSSGIIDVGAENGCEFVDLQKKREIQALRRQEARMKREVKKSRGLNNGVFVEDKLVLEAQQFLTRVEDRENREKNGISDDFALKKEENGRKRVAGDLNISLFTENKNLAMQNKFLFPQMQYLPMRNGFAYPWVVPLWGPNVVEGERNEKSAFRPVAKRNGNGNGSGNSSIDCENREEERSSSVVSDNRSASQKGGSSSDTGSHSSSLVTHQNQHVSRNDEIEHIEVDRASSETEPSKCAGKLNPEQSTKVDSSSFRQLKTSTNKTTERSKSDSQSNQVSSTAEKPSSPLTKETSGLINKPPKPPIQNQNCASLQHMPCVSTTGNGPNGKTVKGFLYKYTKSEVSIVCVCHGSSFSPAEFVEHAGGVDVSHPLKHITVVSSEFGL